MDTLDPALVLTLPKKMVLTLPKKMVLTLPKKMVLTLPKKMVSQNRVIVFFIFLFIYFFLISIFFCSTNVRLAKGTFVITPNELFPNVR